MAGEKKFRVTYKGKSGPVYVTLLATDKEDAERQAERAAVRRYDRFPLTFDRIQQAHERGELDKEQFKAEMEKRKADQARYDGDLKLVKVEEAKT